MLSLSRIAVAVIATLILSTGTGSAMADDGARASAGFPTMQVYTPQRTDPNAALNDRASPEAIDAYRRLARYRPFDPQRTTNACNRARASSNPFDFQGYQPGDLPC